MEEMRKRLFENVAALRSLAEKAGLDRAVIFLLLTRAWQAGAGLVGLLLISIFFAPEVQGYYYTFSSLLALQIFVELALNLIILNLSSHEWSRLRLDASGHIVGDAAALSRLAWLARFVAKWYSVVSFVFVFGVGIGGYFFLSRAGTADISWQAPWWTVVALAAFQLWLMPLLSLLEGCNQVVELNRYRLIQAIAEAFTMWVLLVAGAGLWVAAGSLAVKVAGTLVFLRRRYGRFFRSLRTGAGQARISWRKQIWPMQWRLAVQGVVVYFSSSLFIPIMFHYHGPKVAGQMGMTLQVVSVVQMMAMAWVQTKVPQLGALIARREFAELDTIWWRSSTLSFGFALAGSVAIWIGILVLRQYDMELASRMLDSLPTGLFLVANVLMVVGNCQSLYLRAYAREPFLVVGVLSGLLIGGLVFLFGSQYGPTGAAMAYTAAIGLFVLPMTTMIWKRRRREWQGR